MKIAVSSKSFSKNQTLINELKTLTPHVKLNHATKKLTDDELVEFLSDVDGVILALEELNKEVIDKLPNLKVVSKFGVGLDNVDVEYCKQKGIKVLWEKGTNKNSVAEMALGFMLMLSRNLYISSTKLSNGVWHKDGGFSLSGKKVGIIGVGHIGKELIRLLKPFKCEIYVNDIIEQDEYYNKHGLIKTSKDEIYQNCNIISLHVSLNEQTKHLIDKDALAKMGDDAFLINTSRGQVVNIDELKNALKNGQIAGAAIDVYEEEPPQDLEFLGLENLICTPHIGGNSKEAVLSMGRSAIKNIKDFYDRQ